MRTLIPRNSGSFLNWLTSPRPAAQAASTSSRSHRSPITVEILPGVTLDRLPVRPIRPPSAFNLFLKERMIPGQRAAPQMKELASTWKSVPVEEKVRFENKSKPAMDRYRQEMIEYNKFMGQKITIEKVAELLRKSASVKPPSRPRRKTGYNVFLGEALKGKSGRPDLKAISLEWSALSTGEKQKWNGKAAALS